MPGFVQIIEFDSHHIDEIEKLGLEIEQNREAGTSRSARFTSDRDRPNHYYTIVEFDSYESAMQNSNRPEINDFAKRMADLCDGPPTFHNLDVMRAWE